MCSINLEQMHVSETGQQLDALYLSPFLNIGVIFAVNQSWGRVPDPRELLKSNVRHFDKGFAVFSVSGVVIFNLFSVVGVSRSNVLSAACVVLFNVFSVFCVVMFSLFTVSGVVMLNLFSVSGVVKSNVFFVACVVMFTVLSALCVVDGGFLCKLAVLCVKVNDDVCVAGAVFVFCWYLTSVGFVVGAGGTRLKCVHTIVHISSSEFALLVIVFLEIIGQWVAIWSST